MTWFSAVLDALLPSPPPPPSSEERDRQKQALLAAGDFLKVSTGLATGALVFSLGLLPSVQGGGGWVRFALTLTWVMLFGSVIGGILSQQAIPVLIRDGDFDIQARNFTWPGRAHQLLFLAAMLGLAIVLTTALNTRAPMVATAEQALTRARAALHATEVPDRLEQIDLVSGALGGAASSSGWHLRFHLREGGTVDVLVQSATGAISRVPA